eukprot:PhF_6_TR35354/c0_g1_i1/m.51311
MITQLLCFSLLCLLCNTLGATPITRNRTAYVDTRIGTGGIGWGIGQLNPGPQVPFGCMRLGPDTSIGLEPLRLEFDKFAGYYYNDNYIEGFSHTHVVGAGEGDFQNFAVTVVREWDNNMINNVGYRTLYSHNQEVALPGYYAVELLSHNTYAELTVSGTHSGIHRYTCRPMDPSPAKPCVLLIDICHGVTRSFLDPDIGEACLQGQVTNFTSTDGGNTYVVDAYVFYKGDFSQSSNRGGIPIWFHGEISVRDPNSNKVLKPQPGMWVNHNITSTSPYLQMTTSGSLGVSLSVNAAQPTSYVEFTVRAGISFVSAANARANLDSEQRVKPNQYKTFEQAEQQTIDLWEAYLGRVSVQGGVYSDVEKRTVFETALYHTGLSPTIYSEPSNQQYLGEDWNVHTAAPGTRYLSDLSIWDIYRTQAPWLSIYAPDVAKDLANTMLGMYNMTGDLPVWVFANVETHCMVGRHSAAILADYAVKGLGDLDATEVLNAIANSVGNLCSGSGMTAKGYVPQETDHHGASLTLDYSVDAAAVVLLARALNNTAILNQFTPLSQSYRNTFDSGTRLFCPKYANGTTYCPPPFLPYPWDGDWYTEGNGAQYRWYVPHDLPGLISLFPNPGNFSSELNLFFELSLLWPFNTSFANIAFWAGNEPDILAPYEFNFAGNQYAYLAQQWVVDILDRYYTPYSSGIPGNDDYGTMSAWVVFSYLGIYPIVSTDLYTFVVPRFDDISISIDATAMPFSPWRNSSIGSTNTIIRIRAIGRQPTGYSYIRTIQVNGKNLTVPYMKHADLVNNVGGTDIVVYLNGAATVYGEPSTNEGGPEPFRPDSIFTKSKNTQEEQMKKFMSSFSEKKMSKRLKKRKSSPSP